VETLRLRQAGPLPLGPRWSQKHGEHWEFHHLDESNKQWITIDKKNCDVYQHLH